MNAHNPFDAKQDWTNPYCQNSSNDPMVDALLGNAYHVVRTVYCNLGNLKLLYDFLNQYGMVIGVNSEEELKALSTQVKYSRIYGFSRAGDRQVTDYLYVEGDRTGILPNDTTATGSWITVATSGSAGGGTSSGEGAYIPWVYANGSAAGGETTINVPDGTVGVPFIIINGDMQYVGRGFEFNADSLSVTLAQPLEEGDEVVFLLTGVPAVPDNPNVSDWVQINWLYNNGAAVGGEQVITIPYTFQSIPAVYKNGLRLYKGLTTESYTTDPDNQRILLTEPLATNDRLIVQIGGEAQVLETSDHTLQEVARATNVKDSEVILSTDTTQLLNGKKIVYSVSEQKSYGLPSLPSNIYISSVSNGQLTYNPGNITVTLLPIHQESNTRELWRRLLAEAGLSLVAGSFEEGATVNSETDAVWHIAGGQCYTWGGALPKVVPADSTTTSTGGVGPGAWLVVGVARLEQRLASWEGSSLIDSGSLSLYKKSGVFGDGGNVSDKYQVVLHSDGFWYKYNGTLPVSYGAAPDSSWTNVGKLTGFNEHSPENFGAIPNDPNFDCLPAIKLAIATGTLNLNGNSTYHVTDEVVIPSYLRGNLNGATIKAIGSVWSTLKSVVRVSKFPVGTATVDVANTENQVRGLRLIGSLNVDCADIASYGFYARLMCAESEMGSIYAYNANRYGIVMFACWYFQMGTLHANNCARGMALGYSTEGEQGDTYVNATYFPHISAWGTDKSTGLGYDPITDDASKYTIGAGIILGRGLSTSVGVICSENTAGAGVVTMDPAAWDIGVMYCEGNSKDFTQEGEPKVSLLSSKANSESHTLTISTLHLSAGCGILTRSNQERVLIRSLYRFDNAKTFHSYCTADTVEVGSSNYYVLNGHNYNAPAALIKEPLNVDFVRSGLTLSEWTSTVIGHFAGSTAEQQLYVKLPASPSGLELQIASEDGTEYITVTGTDFKASLTKKRLPSKLYEIRIGGVSTVPVADCSVLVRSKKGDWYYW